MYRYHNYITAATWCCNTSITTILAKGLGFSKKKINPKATKGLEYKFAFVALGFKLFPKNLKIRAFADNI